MNPPDPRSGNATIINMKWQIHVGVSEGIQPWNQGKATGRAHMAHISRNAFLNLYHPISISVQLRFVAAAFFGAVMFPLTLLVTRLAYR